MNTTKTLILPITREYTSYWEFEHGVREVMTNMLDGADHIKANYKISVGEDFAEFENQAPAMLQTSCIAMGSSTSRGNDNNIGQFGEGMKMAWLVLLREGVEITVNNGNETWVPEFRHSEDFGTEIIHVDITTSGPEPREGELCSITVKLHNLTDRLVHRLRSYLETTLVDPLLIRGYQPTIIQLSPTLAISTDTVDAGRVFVEEIPVEAGGSHPMGILVSGPDVRLNRDRDNIGISSYTMSKALTTGMLQRPDCWELLRQMASGYHTHGAVAAVCDTIDKASAALSEDAAQQLWDGLETPLDGSMDKESLTKGLRSFYKFLCDYYDLTIDTSLCTDETGVTFAKMYDSGRTAVNVGEYLMPILRNAQLTLMMGMTDEERIALIKERDRATSDFKQSPAVHIKDLREQLAEYIDTPSTDAREALERTMERLDFLAKRWFTY